MNSLRPAASLLPLTDAAPLSGILSLPRRLPSGAALLCFLHGHGEAQPMDPVMATTMHGPLFAGSALDDEGLALPFLVLAPQLPVAGDHWHVHAARIAEQVQRVERQYATDPARRYLCGFSFGGNGVYDLGYRQPGFWSALWAVDPTRVPETALSMPLWLSIGSTARPYSAEAIARLRSEPLAAEAAEVPAHVTRLHHDAGLGHVETAQDAFADVRAYRWLLRHTR